jgi:hypothetical protein
MNSAGAIVSWRQIAITLIVSYKTLNSVSAEGQRIT